MPPSALSSHRIIYSRFGALRWEYFCRIGDKGAGFRPQMSLLTRVFILARGGAVARPLQVEKCVPNRMERRLEDEAPSSRRATTNDRHCKLAKNPFPRVVLSFVMKRITHLCRSACGVHDSPLLPSIVFQLAMREVRARVVCIPFIAKWQ